jgi:RAT1-interacting protein
MIDHALTTGVSSLNVDKSGTVNSLEAFCTVVRTRLNTHSIVMAGEVDCIDQASYFQSNFDECNLQNSREKTPQSYIELKTSRFIYTDRNKASFKKFVKSSSLSFVTQFFVKEQVNEMVGSIILSRCP